MAHRLQLPRRHRPCRAGQYRLAGCLRTYGAVHSGHRSYGGGLRAELRRRDRNVRQGGACHVLWQLRRRTDVPGAGHRRNLFAVLQPERRKMADDYPLLPGGAEPRPGAGRRPARKGNAGPARHAVGGGAGADPRGRTRSFELQPECQLSPDRHHEGRALGGGRKPHVYPHRLRRFLCHLPGCGFQDDRGRI